MLIETIRYKILPAGTVKKVAGIALGFMIMTSANANPVLDNVASGNVSVEQSPGVTQINQASDQAIINWQSFNINEGERTHFQQPQNGVALNRISPAQGASQIFGQLTATGKIILINQAGIHFGPNAVVDVGGIIASTSNMSDARFLAGQYKFDEPSPYAGSIVNQGSIIAKENGLVALAGTAVSNEGKIQARMGQVVLASGNKFTMDFEGNQLINFVVDEAAPTAGKSPVDGNQMRDGVNNSGEILADGGRVIITAKVAKNVVDRVINMEGVVEANSIQSRNGEIILSGDDGVVRVAGKIHARGKTVGTRGGKVKIMSKRILVDRGAEINVSGQSGGGEILIGGDYQGKTAVTIFDGRQTLANAEATVIMPETNLKADAIENGDGGKIIVWADEVAKTYGHISARGGEFSGNGGFIETSGHYLDVRGMTVDTTAPHGVFGTWLLDPYNVTISSSATANENLATGTYSPTGTGANILNTDLQNALNGGTSIIVTTTGAGAEAGDITVNAPITWTTNRTLTLDAAGSITLNSAITIGNGGGLILQQANFAGFMSQTAAISGSGSLTVQGEGTFDLNQANNYTGATNVNSGAILELLTSNAVGDNTQGTSAINVDSTSYLALYAPLDRSNTPINLSGTLDPFDTVNNAIVSSSGTFSVGIGSTINYNGIISGTGLTLTGSGTHILNAVNTYTGTTAITINTTLKLGRADAITTALTNTSGTFDLNGFSPSIGAITNTNGTINVNGQSLTASSLSGSGTVSLGTNGSLTVGDSSTTTYSGIITGTGGSLTKVGAGILRLSGTNTYTGATTINGGSIQSLASNVIPNSSAMVIGASGSFILNNFTDTIGSLSGSGGVTFSGAGALTVGADNTSTTFSGIISGLGSVLKTGTGTQTLTGASTYTGVTTINQGTIAVNSLQNVGVASPLGAPSTVGNATINIQSSGTLQYTGAGNSTNRVIRLLGSGGSIDASGSGTLTLSGGITENAANLSLNLLGSGSAIESGVISVTGSTVTKSGTGTWTLSGANTYTGATSINAGTLSINTLQNVNGGSSSLGAPTTSGNGTITIGATGVLQYTGSGHSSDRIINLSASGGSIDASGSGALTLSGGVTGNTFNLGLLGSGLATQSGVIATTIGTLTKSGTGTWTLSGANTFSGGLTINAGAVTASNNAALGTGNATIASNAVLNINNVTLSNAVALSGSLVGFGTAILNGDINLNAAAGISTNSTSDTFALNGAINGGQDLTLSGNGALTLAGIIGGSTALSSLTSNAGSTILGNTITTTGSQTYNNAVSLNANSILTSANNITFNNGISGAAKNLTLTGNGSSNIFSITGALTLNDLTLSSLTNGSTRLNLSTNNTSQTYSINNIFGSNSTLELPDRTNTVNITAYGAGSLNDPVAFSGIQTLMGRGVTNVIFGVPAQLNGTSSAVINGQTMFFSGITNFSGDIVVPETAVSIDINQAAAINSAIITAVTPYSTNALAEPTQQQQITQTIQVNNRVNTDLHAILEKQVQIDSNEAQITKVIVHSNDEVEIE